MWEDNKMFNIGIIKVLREFGWISFEEIMVENFANLSKERIKNTRNYQRG